MSLDRTQLVDAFHAAVLACDPADRVRERLLIDDVAPLIAGRRRFGVAVGKAALAMARGAGAVERGVIVIPARGPHDVATCETGTGHEAIDFADVPSGWRVIESGHPFVDERSVIAAKAAREVIDAAGEDDVVLALISGGASSLIEDPIDGLTIEELGATTRAVMESGASIEELNAVRSTLSRVKRGGLVMTCAAPVVTLAVSDVIGDGLAIIGSGPTIGSWFVEDETAPEQPPRDRDVAFAVARMTDFGQAVLSTVGHPSWLEYVEAPLVGDVRACAERLIELVGVSDAKVHGTYVAWGEPTLRVPEDHGEGGRAQQLALHLAKALRGTNLIAMAIGSDGIDGPPPKSRPAPAGAIVDGATWDAIIAAGHDPARALERCDAGTVLDAVGVLVVTGPTGINHGDLVVIGDRHE